VTTEPFTTRFVETQITSSLKTNNLGGCTCGCRHTQLNASMWFACMLGGDFSNPFISSSWLLTLHYHIQLNTCQQYNTSSMFLDGCKLDSRVSLSSTSDGGSEASFDWLDLKSVRSQGCNQCDVWAGSSMICISFSMAIEINSTKLWESCLSSIRICGLSLPILGKDDFSARAWRCPVLSIQMERHSMLILLEHSARQNHGGFYSFYPWLLCVAEYFLSPAALTRAMTVRVSRLPLVLAWRNLVPFCTRTQRGLCSS